MGPLETTMDMLDLVSSAPRRWQLPSEEQLSWPSFPLFQSDVVSGETRSVVLTPSLARLLASVDLSVRLIPAPRGTGIVSAPVPKKLLQMAGIDDCYTSARGYTGP